MGYRARDRALQDQAVRVRDPGDQRAARATAYRALARRARTTAQIRDRLRRRGYDDATVVTVLTGLQVGGYLDDRAFAREWARARVERRGLGREGLRRELEQQGVSREMIEETLGEVYRDVDERLLASSLAARWLRSSLFSSRPGTRGAGGEAGTRRVADRERERARARGPALLKLQRRVRDRLLRRGFGFAVVNAAVRQAAPNAGEHTDRPGAE